MLYTGGCHCGRIGVAFESDVAPAETVVRACQCSFCRMHGSRAIADPGGMLVVRAADEASLSRYVFGFRTADFLVCPRCGVYVAAITRDTERPTGIVTVNALSDRGRFDAVPVPTRHDGESRDERIARRKRTWTPARIEFGAQ